MDVSAPGDDSGAFFPRDPRRFEPVSAETPTETEALRILEREVALGSPEAAHALLDEQPDRVVAEVLGRLLPAHALRILEVFPEARRAEILLLVPESRRGQWEINATYPDQSVGRLMMPPVGIFAPQTTIRDAVEGLREAVKSAFVAYIHVTDSRERLIGVVVMREAVQRHFPVYPVTDDAGRLVGLVRGEDLFQQSVAQLVVQAGSMVGVEKEERLATRWPRALRLRSPWLLLNLATAFAAGAVVGLFEGTIEKVVVLAAFLPILAGQSGNTGCQALAVTLRGMTLGEDAQHRPVAVVAKEAALGLLNGMIVGLIAAVAMYAFARNESNALTLAGIVFVAMVGSCIASGISGALVPMALKRFGADPATASSIFLTTATDIISMGLLLGLATLLI
jgi:magnesium transporter